MAQALDLWVESVERYHERRRRQARAQWFAHFCMMSENHAKLAEDYARRAEELCEDSEATPHAPARPHVEGGVGLTPNPLGEGREQAATTCYEGPCEGTQKGGDEAVLNNV